MRRNFKDIRELLLAVEAGRRDYNNERWFVGMREFLAMVIDHKWATGSAENLFLFDLTQEGRDFLDLCRDEDIFATVSNLIERTVSSTT